MIRCLITDGSAARDERAWLRKLEHWLGEGVELVQIRERELSIRDLVRLTRRVMEIERPHGTRILVNDRADVALVCGAHGVHLRDGSAAASLFARPGFLVSVAAHRVQDVATIEAADFIVLAPIFSPLSKTATRPPLGLDSLGAASRLSGIPILALGGVTEENAPLCVNAGACGVAGISYFAAPASA